MYQNKDVDNILHVLSFIRFKKWACYRVLPYLKKYVLRWLKQHLTVNFFSLNITKYFKILRNIAGIKINTFE